MPWILVPYNMSGPESVLIRCDIKKKKLNSKYIWYLSYLYDLSYLYAYFFGGHNVRKKARGDCIYLLVKNF